MLHVVAVYGIAAWALIQVAVTVAPLLDLPDWTPKLVLLVLTLGFPLALGVSWAFTWTPEEGWRRESPLPPEGTAAADVGRQATSDAATRPDRHRWPLYGSAIAFLALVGVAAYARFGRYPPPEERITSAAVLPFNNLTGDPRNEYLSDGVTEELLNQLTKVRGLHVAARTSAFYFKGKNLPITEIARQLHVAAVVEGSLQRTGSRIRISAQLVSARTGYHLWSERYDRDLRDLFAVEDEISRAIVTALQVELAGPPLPNRAPDPAAHDLYLHGRFLLSRLSRPDLERSIALFDQAIARDSAFAEAYAAAATAWVNLADAWVPPLQAYPKAEILAQRALALDTTNAEAHANLAYARMVLHWDWAGARRELERALALNPHDATTHARYADYLEIRGGPRQALPELRQAAALDPFSAYFADMLGDCWLRLGQLDSAQAAYQRAQEVAPSQVYAGSLGAAIYRAQGRYADALALDQAAAKLRGMPTAGLVSTLVALGRRADAEGAYHEMVVQSGRAYVAPELLAGAALALGRRGEAIAWLERGVAWHSGGAPFGYRFPQLRSDPRYGRLLHRMGLDALAG